ncbi:hypothetical protein COCMIDRAFT_29839 [Bipolaris oryzae ATCC 44560]|uniref:Nephrocystin 3-like N-terminal domain-containing protein n=1 Tax=Bipolaris oryzae ATCC 44560 TaxID=930090 RepID=W6YUZ4_COCMI|nr:uncharacterized protein COCMIDRAFT_29839 [Bipolaris oryzae ATCC 44560]EUC41370.1 hypothetical protein COCMIDRAFT_29839 [Bipolaris oryzae ATCC 44560]
MRYPFPSLRSTVWSSSLVKVLELLRLKQGKRSLLWIKGGPGKGKTMLSIFLAEDLELLLSNEQIKQVAYYFCIRNKRPEIAKHAFPYLELPERRADTLCSLASLWIILQKIIADAALGHLFCIVDGFDECDEDTQRFLIPRFVDQLGSQTSPNRPENLPKFLIVSREIERLECCNKGDLDEDHVSNGGGGDVELLIGEKVDELFHRKRLDNAFRPTV